MCSLHNSSKKPVIKRSFLLLLCACVVFCCPRFQQSARAAEQNDADLDSRTRVGSTTGSACEEYALTTFPQDLYYSYESPIDALAALVYNKLDYVVTTKTDACNYIHKYGGVEICSDGLLLSESSIAVSKTRPGLLTGVNETLGRFLSDGTIERLEKNWIRLDGSPYIQDAIPEDPNAPVVKVAICAGFEPMAFIDKGELRGFDVELIKRVAFDMGYRVQFFETEFTSLLLSLESGRADLAICGLYANPYRHKVADFSRIYFYDTIVLVRRSAQSAVAQSIVHSPGENFRNYFIVDQRWKLIFSGMSVTLMISVCSGVLGMLFGALFCTLRLRRAKPVASIFAMIIRIVQGTPLVLILMLFYYIIVPEHGWSSLIAAIVSFGLSSGVNTAEILRNGIEAVPFEQKEAAAALGLDTLQAFRRVTLPQASRHFMPLIINEYALLIKTTSIVGYVAVQDLTKVSDMIRSRTYEAFFPIVFSAVIYFLLSFVLTQPLHWLKNRIDPDPRSRTIKGVKLS